MTIRLTKLNHAVDNLDALASEIYRNQNLHPPQKFNSIKVEFEKTHRLLQQSVYKKKFNALSEEIYYCKRTLPKLYSIFKVAKCCLNIYKNVINHTLAEKKVFLKHKMVKIQHEFYDNKYLIEYINLNKNSNDEEWFTIVKDSSNISNALYYRLSSIKHYEGLYSYKLGKIKAYQELVPYFEFLLNNDSFLSKTDFFIPFETPTVAPKVKTFHWKASKIDLAEVVLLLFESGAAPNATLKDLASTFSHIFNIDLPDIYNQKKDIKERFDHRFKFVERTVKQANIKMDRDL